LPGFTFIPNHTPQDGTRIALTVQDGDGDGEGLELGEVLELGDVDGSGLDDCVGDVDGLGFEVGDVDGSGIDDCVGEVLGDGKPTIGAPDASSPESGNVGSATGRCACTRRQCTCS
jgi:hypothetical protein